MQINEKLIYPELSYEIYAILFAVHNQLGRFCNEKQYCDAIENYLKSHDIEYVREFILSPSFANELKGRNRLDFIIKGRLLLEVKTKRLIGREVITKLCVT